MSAFVDPKSVLPVIPTRETRVRPSFAPTDDARTASTNPTFTESIPRPQKERIGDGYKDTNRDRPTFDRENDQIVEQDAQPSKASKRLFKEVTQSEIQPTYSAPIFAASDALLDAQQSFIEGDFGFDRPLSRFDFAQSNSAYVNAGAQKGGFAAATAAAIAREQGEREVKIVAPNVTDVNVIV